MSKDEKKEKPTIEESLKNRATTNPPPLHDELVSQALSNASAEESVVGTNPPPNIPVSNIAPQHVTPNCSPGSVETSPIPIPETTNTAETGTKLADEVSPDANEIKTDDIPVELQSLKDFISSDGFNEATVGYMITTICSQPRGIPFPGSWDVPKNFNIARRVYDHIRADGTIDSLWPALQHIMGTNIGNTYWTVTVAVTLAFFQLIHFIPTILEMEQRDS